ncbi:MAG: DUF2510 domain-containing protein [Cellulomonas sp.]
MSSIAPGWYPDPDPSASPGRQRWYDGTGWTAHVAAPAVAPAPPVAPFAPVYTAPAAQPPAYGAAPSALPSPYGTPPAAQPSPYGSPYGTPYGGRPAGIPYAPAVPLHADRPWTQPADGRIVVGSMTKEQFKALPRQERVAKNRPDIDLARGRNSLAFNGVIAAAVSFVISGYLVVAIVGIVWSARGLKRANDFEAQGYPPLGRSQATTGLVLGIVSAVLGAFSLAVRLSSL